VTKQSVLAQLKAKRALKQIGNASTSQKPAVYSRIGHYKLNANCFPCNQAANELNQMQHNHATLPSLVNLLHNDKRSPLLYEEYRFDGWMSLTTSRCTGRGGWGLTIPSVQVDR
jgi:hypothetical protein